MKVYTLDPLLDPRWARFISLHPRSSIFHTRGWVDALHRTYGYTPIVYTTTSPTKELTNGLLFCEVKSWLTGRRLVSLPFSDHCEPLVDTREEWKLLVSAVIHETHCNGYRYLQIRPLAKQPDGGARMVLSDSFYLHTVDLRPELKELFLTFHKSCVQRKIRRAERERLSVTEGRSPELIGQFYQLLMATRRRHQIPPQPFAWFRNLVDCLDNAVSIRVASKDGQPIASILTLSFANRAYYKYGCSDKRFHNLGGMQLLLWKTIQEEKDRGVQILDLGRSDVEQTGLANFKDHWGDNRSLLTYYRYPPVVQEPKVHKWTAEVARFTIAQLPDSLFATAGRFLYPHIG